MARGEDTAHHPGRSGTRESYVSRTLSMPGAEAAAAGASGSPRCNEGSITCNKRVDPTMHLHPSGEFISTGLGYNHFVNRDDRINEVRGSLAAYKRSKGIPT